ncbi:MAG: PstS family phosphate ABC transporter substrate-binding protein [Anaerolineae bacterium]
MKQTLYTCPRYLAILALAISLILSACCSDATQNEGELKGTLTVSGAWALYPMMVRWGEEFQAQHPGVQFDISAGGAGKGMADVLGGAVDIGMVSREVHPEEAAQGAWWVAVTMDAVLPTMNSDNPHLAQIQAQGLTRETLEAIWMGEIKTWGEVIDDPSITDEIHVYTRSDACGAAETWAVYLGDYKQEDLQGVAVYGDPGLATAVSEDALGVGYNNLNFAYDADTDRPVAKIHIMPIDRNENGQVDADESFYATKAELTAAIADGRYPAPPARALYLVTMEAPDALTKTFIEWVLTDGQAFVDETGYIQLSQVQLQDGLEKLKADSE